MAPSSPANRVQAAGQQRAPAWRRRWPLATAAAVLIAALGTALAVAGGGQEAAAPQASPPAEAGPAPLDERVDTDGRPLPDISFEMFDGQTASFADFRGQPLVINFFAAWCASCLAELPELQKVYAANRPHVEFLGVNLQDSRDAAAELIDWAELTYPIAMDPRGELFRALRAHAMPTTLFVTADGTIAEVYSGELTAEQLADRLRRHGLMPTEAASR